MNLLQTLFNAPPADWIRFAVFFVGILLFIALAEKARSALGWPAEVNRKLVHVGTGVLIFFCAFLFESNVPLIWMAIVFMIVNFVGIRTGLLKGMHGTRRFTYGTVFYPLTFLILVAGCWENHKVILMMSMLILFILTLMKTTASSNPLYAVLSICILGGIAAFCVHGMVDKHPPGGYAPFYAMMAVGAAANLLDRKQRHSKQS